MHDKAAGDATLFYPGKNLSESEKNRLEEFATELSDLTADHVIYSLSRQVENNFQTFYSVAEDVIGEEKALELAFEIGRRYGGTGYATWLKARGYDGRGNPATMASAIRIWCTPSEARSTRPLCSPNTTLCAASCAVMPASTTTLTDPRTASTPARSSVVASRATRPPTRTCSRSSSTPAVGGATEAAISPGSTTRAICALPSSGWVRRERTDYHVNIGYVIERAAKRYGDRIALRNDAQSLTFAEVGDRVGRLARTARMGSSAGRSCSRSTAKLDHLRRDRPRARVGRLVPGRAQLSPEPPRLAQRRLRLRPPSTDLLTRVRRVRAPASRCSRAVHLHGAGR